MATNAFVVTADGSKTLFHAGIGERYHSKHGAVQESRHVFIGMGLSYFLDLHQPESVSILEIGLGTGLNFLLSADYCIRNQVKLDYVGVEAHPLSAELIAQTGYNEYVSAALWTSFLTQYSNSWSSPQVIRPDCVLTAKDREILHFTTGKRFDILYFDAFASTRQPEMWSEETLRHVCSFIKTDGVFVTYAITGHLKRTLKGLGFSVEKLPGAPGKREMLRAIKI